MEHHNKEITIAGVGVIVKLNDKFLCIREKFEDKSLGKDINSLAFPQGHLDTNRSTEDIAIQEVLEETGYKVKLNFIIGIYNIGRAIGIVYSGDLVNEAVDTESKTNEASEVIWLTKDEILSDSNVRPAVKEALNDYLNGKTYPLDLVSNLINV